ncbi:hypothetical protein [Coleofasciculus sp. FACHB-1120]|uniref:hypothetical protein n=1 Tax=Coleofasciculus sp. FACHB-1120 TaxID=2692783 RepID=UPI001689ED50|nr:hypothetical protein [Coleofasciculus sp. FACHB-1120]MBD2741826.1 hypothetical protein [Coleofasciculus sp. FACHB-1120]
MIKTISLAALAIGASVCFPDTAKAAILNGGFEEGFQSWKTVGDYRIETSAFGIKPSQGKSQAFLSTAYQELLGFDNNSNPIIGGNAAPVTFISGFAEEESLEGFLGFSTFLGDESLYDLATAEPIEGSAIKQTFKGSTGQKLSFSWNFLTNEAVEQAAVNDFTYPDFNDFAFVSLQSDSGTQFFNLADTISKFSDSASVFNKETGLQTFSYILPASGEYTLGIGVVDVGDGTRISALVVDEVAVVPETTPTLGILLFGTLATITGLKGRKKNPGLLS